MGLTIKEIAEMAQVAKSTVSKVLNGQKGISEEKRNRILKIIQEVNYQPNSAARALSKKQNGTIGFILPHEAGYSLSGLYWTEIVTAVASEVARHGNNLMIITPAEEGEPFHNLEAAIRSHVIDGLIIGAEQIDTKNMYLIMSENIPFVFIGQNQTLQHFCVDVDNQEGSEKIISQLIDHGYKKIACISGPQEYQYTRERLDGFRNIMMKAGLEAGRVFHTSYHEEDAMKTATKLIETFPDTDAIYITAGGAFALAIFDALRFGGISLKDIGFGIFDDNKIFDFLDFPIITAEQPIKQMGTLATKILFDQLAGNPPEEFVHRLPVNIVLR